MALFLSSGRIESFDSLQHADSVSYLIEIGVPLPSQGERRDRKNETTWDWCLDPVIILLPVGLDGFPAEAVETRVSGSGIAKPLSVDLEPRSVHPYVAERIRLLEI